MTHTYGWRIWIMARNRSGKLHLTPPLTSRYQSGPFKAPIWTNELTVAAACHQCNNPPAPDHGCGIYFFPHIDDLVLLLRGCGPEDPIFPTAHTVVTYGRTLGRVLPDPVELLDVKRCAVYQITGIWRTTEL